MHHHLYNVSHTMHQACNPCHTTHRIQYVPHTTHVTNTNTNIRYTPHMMHQKHMTYMTHTITHTDMPHMSGAVYIFVHIAYIEYTPCHMMIMHVA